MSDDTLTPVAETPAIPEPLVTLGPASANGHAPLKRLSALERLFEARGEARVLCGQRELVVPIKSVDLEAVEALCRPYRAIPRISIALNKGKREEVAHTQEQSYLDAVTRYNRINLFVYVLCGLDLDVEDKYGKVVWSADNTTHEVDPAMQALKDMGIVDNQVLAIFQSITALTQVQEERQVED